MGTDDEDLEENQECIIGYWKKMMDIVAESLPYLMVVWKTGFVSDFQVFKVQSVFLFA